MASKTTQKQQRKGQKVSRFGKIIKPMLAATAILLLTTFPNKSKAADDGQIKIITDIEMDYLISDITKAIFKVANMDISKVKIHIVSDPSVNAFVYQSSVFVNTGLIAFARTTDAIFGVLAHETGHVARRHISRMVMYEQENSGKMGGLIALTAIMMIGLSPAALGVILPSAVAVPMVGLSLYSQGRLKFSRDKESEADQSAIIYLHKLNKSVEGMYETMSLFHDEMGDQPEFAKYLYRHPLPSERMHTLRIALQKEKNANTVVKEPNCELEFRLRRVKAKILGYLDDGRYEKIYDLKDPHKCFTKKDIDFFLQYKTLHQRWKERDTSAALEICENLIAQRPNDIFLLETKANLVMALHGPQVALPIYRQFAKLHNTTSAKQQLAQMLTTSNRQEDLEESISIYKELISQMPEEGSNYFSIAAAYSKLGNIIQHRLNMAEGFVRMKNYQQAMPYALKVAKIKCKTNDQTCIFHKETGQDIVEACSAYIKGKKKKAEAKKATL